MTKTDLQIYIGAAGVAVSLYIFWKSKETVKNAAEAVGEALDITSDTNIASKAVHSVSKAVGFDFDAWADGVFKDLGLGEKPLNDVNPYKPVTTTKTTPPISDLFPAIKAGVKPVVKTGGILHG